MEENRNSIEFKVDLLSPYYYTIEKLDGDLVVAIDQEDNRFAPLDLGGFNLSSQAENDQDYFSFFSELAELIEQQEIETDENMLIQRYSDSIYRIMANNRCLSFYEVIRGFSHSSFVTKYRQCLSSLNLREFFWEHPSLSTANLGKPYEVSIIPTTAFNGRRPQPEQFRNKYTQENSISLFQNLSGSALLLVPNPDLDDQNKIRDYGSFGRFLSNADDEKIARLFKALSETWSEQLQNDTDFRYVSTHGLGVIWLHIRFDRRPKYYHTRGYRQTT